MFERQVTCLVPGRSMETYHGHVRTPADAVILFEACRVGLLPRVQRRLSEKERASISSGSVFVWDEREAGMRRWTDGKSWSASRVSGSFLTYREMEGKRSGPSGGTPGTAAVKRQGSEGDDSPDGYRYKADGLMKQSFSISTSVGQHLHLISYYSRAPHIAQGLPTPSQDPRLRHIRPEKGMYPESNMPEQHPPHPVVPGPGSSRMPVGGHNYAAAHGSPHSMHAQSPYRNAQHDYPPYRSGHGHGPAGPGPGPGLPGWGPPSPMHTPSQSPYPLQASHPYGPNGGMPSQSPLQQMHYPPPASRQHTPGQATAFDRPPAPLSNKTVPNVPGPPPGSSPYYIPPSGHQSSYPAPPPPPPALSSTDRLTPPSSRKLPSLEASGGEPRQDSILKGRHDQSPSRVSVSPTSRPTIPSISTLINGVSPTEPTKPEERPASAALRPMQDLPPIKNGVFNPDARALRDLDKLTFRA